MIAKISVTIWKKRKSIRRSRVPANRARNSKFWKCFHAPRSWIVVIPFYQLRISRSNLTFRSRHVMQVGRPPTDRHDRARTRLTGLGISFVSPVYAALSMYVRWSYVGFCGGVSSFPKWNVANSNNVTFEPQLKMWFESQVSLPCRFASSVFATFVDFF